MKTVFTLSSIIVVFSMTSQIATAAPPAMNSMRDNWQQARVENIMERFDLNGDNQITLDEVQSQHAARFLQMDTDGNGSLSAEEFQKAAPANGMAGGRGRGNGQGNGRGKLLRFNNMDADGNGQVSMVEFSANLPLFDRFDQEADGIITKDDLLQTPCQIQ